MQTTIGRNETGKKEIASSTDGKINIASGHQENSLNSEGLSNDLKEPYQKPTTVKALAMQANEVATKVLNGEIDLDKAAKYSAIIRATAQLMSLEVAKARIEKQKIDLDL